MASDTTIKDEKRLSKLVHEWLLAKIGSKEELQLNRTIHDCWIKLTSTKSHTRHRVGDFSEGCWLFRDGQSDFFSFNDCRVVFSDYSESEGDSVVLQCVPDDLSPLRCKLKLVSERFLDADLYETINGCCYLSGTKFLQTCRGLIPEKLLGQLSPNTESDSPNFKYGGMEFNLCLECPWSDHVQDLITRTQQRTWPSVYIVGSLISRGCLLVPVGNTNPSDSTQDLYWNYSFALAENTLIRSLSHFQYLLFQAFSFFVKEFVCREEETDSGDISLSNWYESCFKTATKHCFFWMIEDYFPNIPFVENFGKHLLEIIHKFRRCVEANEFHNYFIPEVNLIQQRIPDNLRQAVLERLQDVTQNWCSSLLKCPRFSSLKEFIEKNDIHIERETDISLEVQRNFDYFYILTLFTHSTVGMKELSERLGNAVRLRGETLDNDSFGMYIFQTNALFVSLGREIFDLSSRQQNKTSYKQFALCKSLLKKGSKKDITDGRLALATFYFLTGQMEASLFVIEDVTSRYQPSVVYRSYKNGILANSTRTIAFKEKTCGKKEFSWQKITSSLATDYEVFASLKNPLVPECLLNEMWLKTAPPFRYFHIPPMPYAFFLQTMIYCSLPSLPNGLKMECIHSLQATLYDEEMVGYECLVHNMIGLCLERIGSNAEAMQEYMTSYKIERDAETSDEENPALWRMCFLINRQPS